MAKTNPRAFEGIFKEPPNQYFVTEHYDISRYWDGLGQYQAEWDALTEELVPEYGKAQYEAGEAVRAINALIAECYNNAFLNNVTASYYFLDNLFEKHKIDIPFWEDLEPFVRCTRRPRIDGSCLGSIFDAAVDALFDLIHEKPWMKEYMCLRYMDDFECSERSDFNDEDSTDSDDNSDQCSVNSSAASTEDSDDESIDSMAE